METGSDLVYNGNSVRMTKDAVLYGIYKAAKPRVIIK